MMEPDARDIMQMQESTDLGGRDPAGLRDRPSGGRVKATGGRRLPGYQIGASPTHGWFVGDGYSPRPGDRRRFGLPRRTRPSVVAFGVGRHGAEWCGFGVSLRRSCQMFKWLRKPDWWKRLSYRTRRGIRLVFLAYLILLVIFVVGVLLILPLQVADWQNAQRGFLVNLGQGLLFFCGAWLYDVLTKPAHTSG